MEHEILAVLFRDIGVPFLILLFEVDEKRHVVLQNLGGGRYGVQTMCESGGMANATLVERL